MLSRVCWSVRSRISQLGTLVRNKHCLSLQTLQDKSIIAVKGKDAKQFLQGLITNDMCCLEHGSAVIYTMLLNAKGRVLYDLFLYGSSVESENQLYYVECEKHRAEELIKYLTVYRLRKKVVFELQPHLCTAVFFPTPRDEMSYHSGDDVEIHLSNFHLTTANKSKFNFQHFSSDPRVKNWCARLLWDSDVCKNVETVLEGGESIHRVSTNEDLYRVSRYAMGIGEGSIDLPSTQCLPLECNADLLNGVSFNKGCYVGQELTARTHHTGVTRKRFLPLQFSSSVNSPISTNADVFSASDETKSIGRVRSVHGKYGLGLLRLSNILSLIASGESKVNLMVTAADGQKVPCHTYLPFWWPPNVGLGVAN